MTRHIYGDPWTVKDIVSHVIGWPEASLKPKEMARQFLAGWRTREEHGGTLNAQNEFQVTDRRRATPEELIARLERLQPGFHRLRNGLGVVGRVIPYKEQFTGTWVSLAFIVDAIFARDHFMHLLDIHRAVRSDPEIGPAEIRVAHDAIREWATKADADTSRRGAPTCFGAAMLSASPSSRQGYRASPEGFSYSKRRRPIVFLRPSGRTRA